MCVVHFPNFNRIIGDKCDQKDKTMLTDFAKYKTSKAIAPAKGVPKTEANPADS
jgi:hypothetical protein